MSTAYSKFPDSICQKFEGEVDGINRHIQNSTNARWMLRQVPLKPLEDNEIKFIKLTARSKLRVSMDSNGEVTAVQVGDSSAVNAGAIQGTPTKTHKSVKTNKVGSSLLLARLNSMEKELVQLKSQLTQTGQRSQIVVEKPIATSAHEVTCAPEKTSAI